MEHVTKVKAVMYTFTALITIGTIGIWGTLFKKYDC